MFIPIDKNGFWANRSLPRQSLETAANLFDERKGEIIVEIGSGLHGKMSGDSIIVWAENTSAKRIVAVDTAQEKIDQVVSATSQFPNVEAVVDDGIQYLKNFESTIDLLYLDFWAGDPAGVSPGEGRAAAYRQAYVEAKNKLSENY